MVRAVDLDHEVAAVPPDIEVDASPCAVPDDLTARLGQAASSTATREIQLAQGLDARRDVSNHRRDERPSRASTNGSLSRGQKGRSRELLLDGHEQHESCLPIRDRPVSSADRGHRRTYSRHPRCEHLIRNATNDLVDRDAPGGDGVVVVLGGHVDPVVLVALHPGSLQRGHPVDGRDRLPDLPDRAPSSGDDIERCGVDRDGLPAVHPPPTRLDGSADVDLAQPGGIQLAARHDSVLALRQSARRGEPFPVHGLRLAHRGRLSDREGQPCGRRAPGPGGCGLVTLPVDVFDGHP